MSTGMAYLAVAGRTQPGAARVAQRIRHFSGDAGRVLDGQLRCLARQAHGTTAFYSRTAARFPLSPAIAAARMRFAAIAA